MDATKLIERRGILKELSSRIVLCRPVTLRPHGSLLGTYRSIAWDDDVEAARKTFDFDVGGENLTDLVPRQERRAGN
jgi:hypothetical protein